MILFRCCLLLLESHIYQAEIDLISLLGPCLTGKVLEAQEVVQLTKDTRASSWQSWVSTHTGQQSVHSRVYVVIQPLCFHV